MKGESKRGLTILTNSEKETKGTEKYREANSEKIKASKREYNRIEIDYAVCN